MVHERPPLTAEAAFRAARLRARGNRTARDLAAALAVLRGGFSIAQARAGWIRAEPAMKTAVAYVRAILAKAVTILRQERAASPKNPRPRP